MFPIRFTATLALGALLALAACTDERSPTAPRAGAGAAAAGPDRRAGDPADTALVRARTEALAERLARALADDGFRGEVRDALARSPYREGKLPFRRFLAAGGGRLAGELARLSGTPDDELRDLLDRAIPLELYLPVPAHREGWRGDAGLLVATGLADFEPPVAYTPAGARRMLDPYTPPAEPVLALVPRETDFDVPGPLFQDACPEGDCPGGGGGGGGTTPEPTPGLYMTRSHLNETFESWLKGSPEIEALVLGQKGQTDSLTSYQCIGERASGAYRFDQNDKDWAGEVLVFSQAQLDAYRKQHPDQSVRLFFMEDDDTSCQIKTDSKTFKDVLDAIDQGNRDLTGGKDEKTGTGSRIWKYFRVFQKIYSVVASFINTNDELIGNAVEDDVAIEFHTGYNWILKGEDNRTNGYINLQMR